VGEGRGNAELQMYPAARLEEVTTENVIQILEREEYKGKAQSYCYEQRKE
jgi:hypothetical protein